jgi:hypothetical protein
MSFESFIFSIVWGLRPSDNAILDSITLYLLVGIYRWYYEQTTGCLFCQR